MMKKGKEYRQFYLFGIMSAVLGFGFYIPVVLWADTVPAIGFLMMPKTIAYVWTVLIGYNAMKKEISR